MRLLQLISEATEEIQSLYLKDSIPWVIGCSWGKDSSCTLQLIWRAIAQLPSEQRKKKISVITTNTGVENPIIEHFCQDSIFLFNQKAKELKLPFTAHLLSPSINNSYWVLAIGKGYSKPNHRHRWCTPRLKIEPGDRFIKKHIAHHGESLLVLGVRKDESLARKNSIEKHEQNSQEPRLSPSASLLNCTVYTPIVEWTTEEVWMYLLQIKNPWRGSNQKLFDIYHGATDSTECPLVVEENTTTCGKSRFGCYVCTVTDKEHSLTVTIDNNPSFEWLEPLLELREELANSSYDDRELRETKSGVRFHDNQVNSQNNLEPTPGKYHQKYRIKLLKQLLTAQKQIRQTAPQEYQDLELISLEELSLIRYLWVIEKVEEDILPEIYEQILGQKYIELHPERLEHRLSSDIWQTVSELKLPQAEQNAFVALLATEQKYLTRHRRQGLHQELENCLYKQQTMSKAEAIYRGYLTKMTNLKDKTPEVIHFLMLVNREITKDKPLKFI